MQNHKVFILVLASIFILLTAEAKNTKILFVGNSFTYEPGDVLQPELPNQVGAVAKDLNLDIQIDFVVKGGQTLKRHFDEGQVAAKLHSKAYDFVVIQAQSIEPIALPKCFVQNGGPIGRTEFLEYATKLIKMVKDNGATPILFNHWTYQADHPWLKNDFLCLKFAADEMSAGQNWFGNNLSDYQHMLNQGFKLAQQSNSTTKILAIGDKWQNILNDPKGIINDSTFYQDDHMHPTIHGTYFNALVLVHDILNQDISRIQYHPNKISTDEFKYLKLKASR